MMDSILPHSSSNVIEHSFQVDFFACNLCIIFFAHQNDRTEKRSPQFFLSFHRAILCFRIQQQGVVLVIITSATIHSNLKIHISNCFQLND
eukprot:UN06023